jgi:hypothetical protein
MNCRLDYLILCPLCHLSLGRGGVAALVVVRWRSVTRDLLPQLSQNASQILGFKCPFAWIVFRAVDRYAYVVEALLVAIYLRTFVYTFDLPRHLATLPPGACLAEPSATSTQLNLYEPASSNQNTACSQHIAAEKKKPLCTDPDGKQLENMF